MNQISTLREKIKKSKFGKNILLIAGGTAFAQILGVVFSPIITRLYPPEQFGVVTAYSAILGLIVISSSLDYQKAIPIEEDEHRAANLLVVSLFILLTIVSMIFFALFFYGDYLLELLNSETLISYKYLIPIGVLVAGIYNILIEWGLRDRNYKVISRTKISQSITSNIIKVVLGILKIGPIGLIIGVIIGQSAGVTSLTIPILKKIKFQSSIKIDELKFVLKRYKKFPLYSAPSNYVYTAGNNLPVILLASIFGSSVTGLFGLAKSITYMPMSLIGISVSQVFFSEAARIGKSDPQKIKNISIKLMQRIAIIALIPFIVLLVFGPWLFALVFGNQWYDAGIYAQILSVMVYFHFIISPIGRVLEIFEFQREGLILNIIRLGVTLLIFYVAKIIKINSYQTVALYSASNAVIYIALLVMVIRILNGEIRKINND